MNPGDRGQVAFLGRFIGRVLKRHGNGTNDNGQYLTGCRQRNRQRRIINRIEANIRAEDLSGPLTRKTLKEKVKFDGAKYDDERSYRAGHLLAFLHENGLGAVPELMALAQNGLA